METPTVREARQRIVALRLTDAEYAELTDAASNDDRPVSVFIRLSALMRARALRDMSREGPTTKTGNAMAHQRNGRLERGPLIKDS